jgi:hypothetical protein
MSISLPTEFVQTAALREANFAWAINETNDGSTQKKKGFLMHSNIFSK